VQEYLASSWRPDRDFVDGELLERKMGEFSYGGLQLNIGVCLRSRETAWRFRAFSVVRLQVSASWFQVPDLMLVSGDAPRGNHPDSAADLY
jgi:hypothetical protein